MRNIIDDIVGGGGGKRPNYLLTAFLTLLMFSSVQIAQAANPSQGFYWTGVADETSDWKDNTNCWRYYKGNVAVGKGTTPGGTQGSYLPGTKYVTYFRSSVESFKNATVTFSDTQQIGNTLWIDSGTSLDSPIVFEAADSGNGLTSSAAVYLGFDGNPDGYLRIQGGTYSCTDLNIGQNAASPTHAGWLCLDATDVDTTLSASGTMYLHNGWCYATNATVNAKSLHMCVKSGSQSYLYKTDGEWTIENGSNGRLYLGYASGTRAEFYHRGGSLITSSYICIGAFTSSDSTKSGYAYFELDGGIVSNKTNTIIIADKTGTTSDKAVLRVKNGTLAANTDLKVGMQYSGELIMDGGEADVSRGTIAIAGGAAGTDSALVLSNGVVKTRSISVIDGKEANATILFDGGTLQAAQAGTLLPASDRMTVSIGPRGGTIATDGNAVAIDEDLSGTGGMAFTGGGTVALTGALNYTGATTNDAATTLSAVDNALTFAGPLVLEATSKIKTSRFAPNAVSATAVELPASGTVVLDFDDSRAVADTYSILSITGDGAFAAGDEAKFVLGENAPEGATFSVSQDGKSIQLTIPASNPATWTGGANDYKFSSVDNWLGHVVPGALDDVVINVASETTLDCDVDLNVNSIYFAPASAKVTITGTGSITNATAIVNDSAVRHVVNVPVEFVASDVYVPIDVTGEVDFQGGVKGTVPANHTTFYGNYTLTATSWTLTEAITLAANATVTASGMTLNTAGMTLSAGTGAKLELDALKPKSAESIFGSFAGDLTLREFFPETGNSLSFNSGFTGTLRVGDIDYHSQGSAKTLTFSPDASADIVVTNKVAVMRGTVKVEGVSFKSSGDWQFTSRKNGYNSSSTISIGSAGIEIDTSDFDNPEAAGHEVTVASANTSYADNILSGSGGVIAKGNGSLVFKKTAQFTGGLTVSDSVTLGVNAGVSPGLGDVTVGDSAKLRLRGASGGTATVAGTLAMEGGTMLQIPELAAGVLPLSVNALAFGGEGAVTLDIETVPDEVGYYAILSSATALPEDAAAKFALPAESGVSLYVSGNTLFLAVGDTSDLPAGVWVGGIDANLSTPGNWKNLAVPETGTDLDFSGLTHDATINADVPDTVYGTIRLPSNVVSLQGSLHLTTLTNALNLAVEADATLTVDEDAVLNNDGGSGNYRYMFRYNKGRIEIGGRFVNSANPNTGALLYYSPDSTGTISVGGLTNTVATVFSLCGNHKTPITWVVGTYGITRADGAYGFSQFGSGNGEITLKAGADFTASAPIAVKSSVKFDTTDENGNVRTITLTGGLEGSGPVTIAGTGTFVADRESTLSGAVTVTDTATLALNAGSNLGTGAITVNAGAALEVAESGTVALGGNLALTNNAVLAFNWTTRAAPKLDLTDKTVIFEEGETTNLVVRISAKDGARAWAGDNVLTVGGKFAGMKPSLADDAPAWVKGVDVNAEGNIVLDVKPVGFVMIVQ